MAVILLIEDDQLSRFTVHKVLDLAGHMVTVVESGNEGLRLAKAQSFDLIITDIVMPERHGLAVIISVKKRKPSQRILAITGGGVDGYGKSTYGNAADEFGADAILFKPFTGGELLSCVADCLEAG